MDKNDSPKVRNEEKFLEAMRPLALPPRDYAVPRCAVRLMACSALPALAIGRLPDFNLIDRSTGNTLPVYMYRGEYWVAGQPEARYAISVRNKGGERLLAVTSVDGINVLNGASAGVNQSRWRRPRPHPYQQSAGSAARMAWPANHASAKKQHPPRQPVLQKAWRSIWKVAVRLRDAQQHGFTEIAALLE